MSCSYFKLELLDRCDRQKPELCRGSSYVPVAGDGHMRYYGLIYWPIKVMGFYYGSFCNSSAIQARESFCYTVTLAQAQTTNVMASLPVNNQY